ncbi:MAG: hypothetical protein ABW120_12590 [Sedimenticola sp.]
MALITLILLISGIDLFFLHDLNRDKLGQIQAEFDTRLHTAHDHLVDQMIVTAIAQSLPD